MPSHDSPDLENDHNAYILGAGYSADAGLPLMWNFLQVMRDAVLALDPMKYKDEVAAMKYVFEFRREAAAAGYRAKLNVENIEELFSLASALERDNAENQIRLAIAGTLVYALGSVREQPTRCVSIKKALGKELNKPPAGWSVDASRHGQDVDFWRVPEYHFRAAMMCGAFCPIGEHRKTSIITFNYDTLVEAALTELGVPFAMAGPTVPKGKLAESQFTQRAGEVSLYKLHGSVGWAVPAPEDEPRKVAAFGDYAELNEAKLPPVIQPPTWRKDFGDLFYDVWTGAVRALNTATRLIVIGFSMPDTDVYVRFLLAAGLAKNISLREIVFVNNTGEINVFQQRVLKCFREELFDRGELGFCQRSAQTYFSQLAYGRVDIGDDKRGACFRLGRSLVNGEFQLAT